MLKVAIGGAVAVFAIATSICLIVFFVQVFRARKAAALLKCDRCWGSDVRLSRSDKVYDVFFALFSCYPYRCRVCWRRFYRFTGATKQAVGDGIGPAPAAVFTPMHDRAVYAASAASFLSVERRASRTPARRKRVCPERFRQQCCAGCRLLPTRLPLRRRASFAASYPAFPCKSRLRAGASHSG